MAKDKMELLVCGGTGCRASESEQILNNLKDGLASRNITDVQVLVFAKKGLLLR